MTEQADWYGPDAATFGDRVAAAREMAGMSQAALAKRLGVKQSTLRSWEDDVSEPRANRLSMLAGLLNISMMWLINGEGEGLDDPDIVTPHNSDLSEILTDIRGLRIEMQKRTESMGRLEKRVRKMLEDTTHG